MINVKSLVFSCFCACRFVYADYICVENATNKHLRFRLSDAHYDVYEYQFLPKEGGLGNERILESDSEIVLVPKQKIMLRTMYSYSKSGGRSSLELSDETGTIVFASNSLDDFKLSDSLEVKVLSRLDVLGDDFSGLADKVYRIEESKSAPSSPKKSAVSSSSRLRSSSMPSKP